MAWVGHQSYLGTTFCRSAAVAVIAAVQTLVV